MEFFNHNVLYHRVHILSTLKFPASISAYAANIQSLQTLPIFSINNRGKDTVTTSSQSPSGSEITLFCYQTFLTTGNIPALSNFNQNMVQEHELLIFYHYHGKDSVKSKNFRDKYVDFAALIPTFGFEGELALFEFQVTTLKCLQKKNICIISVLFNGASLRQFYSNFLGGRVV